MKILYLHNANPDSQMANLIQVRSMCSAMSLLGKEIILSLPATEKWGGVESSSNDPFKYHYRKPISLNKRIDKYINISSVKRAIKQHEPDICYLRSPLLLRQVLSSSKPIIIELHNNQLHQRFGWLDKYWRKVLRKAVKRGQVQLVVCISQALSNFWIQEGIPSDKVVTAHDGIDVDTFLNQIDRLEARRKIGYPVEKKIVTYAGRLYKNRKIENIVELARHYPEVLFVVIGGPEERSAYYKKLAQQKGLDNVKVIGQIPHSQISDYLYASDVLLALWSSEVPTMNYCSPLKVFEYMGAGRNIVAHGFPTIKEVLHDEHNALLVEPDSLEDLIKKTGEALKLSYPSKMAEQARKDVFKHYTWEQRAQKILSPFLTMEEFSTV